jgi:D-glycero-D-manno-heptose 1,7-bisphosphate phosphatase
MTTPQRVIFLDRDGTINIDHGYVHRIEDWEFAEQAPEALRIIKNEDFKLAVVSNQAGIADGRFDSDAVDRLHNHLKGLLKDAGVMLDVIAYCPHHRDGDCICRKPNPGLAQFVEDRIGAIDYANSWVVGDKESDIGFGKNIGSKTALIRSDYWNAKNLKVQPDMIVDSLFDFAMKITDHSSGFDKTHWRNEKILTPDEAADIALKLHSDGQKLVTVNGSFDLLHAGHLDQLEEARMQGDVLFVGLNVDQAINEAKGPNRPLIPEEARAAMLAALTCVDYVVFMTGSYSEEPMKSLLEKVKPEVQVNGPDYGSAETWVEWPTMRKYGTRAHTIQKRNDFSTSSIVNKIKNSI